MSSAPGSLFRNPALADLPQAARHLADDVSLNLGGCSRHHFVAAGPPDAADGARDRQQALLEWLAQGIPGWAVELGKLVKEQNAVVTGA